MKNKYLLILAIICLIFGGIGWVSSPRLELDFPPTVIGEKIPEKLATHPPSSPRIKKLPQPIITPQINPQFLWEYIAQLPQERYSEEGRNTTRNWIIPKLQKWGYSPQLQSFPQGKNIIIERPGMNPQLGTILVGAHYDTVLNSPGGDDNGSGVAVILELARLYQDKTPLHPLKIVFFDEEEPGLLGSFAFTNQPDNINNLAAVIILDMVGFACHQPGCQKYPQGLPVKDLLKVAQVKSPDQGEFLAVVGEIDQTSFLSIFSQKNQSNYPTVVTVPIPLKGLLTPDVLRSDHAPFWYQGIKAVLVTDTANLRSPHYHQSSDTIETLDRSFFMGSAQIIVNVTQKLLENAELPTSPTSSFRTRSSRL